MNLANKIPFLTLLFAGLGGEASGQNVLLWPTNYSYTFVRQYRNQTSKWKLFPGWKDDMMNTAVLGSKRLTEEHIVYHGSVDRPMTIETFVYGQIGAVAYDPIRGELVSVNYFNQKSGFILGNTNSYRPDSINRRIWYPTFVGTRIIREDDFSRTVETGSAIIFQANNIANSAQILTIPLRSGTNVFRFKKRLMAGANIVFPLDLSAGNAAQPGRSPEVEYFWFYEEEITSEDANF